MAADRDVLFEASPSPVMRLSREGTVVALNRAARKVFAIEPERVIGKPVLGMIVPEDRARIRDLFLRVLQGQACEWTTRFRRGDAATRLQRVRAVPSGANGRAECIIMFTADLGDPSDGDPEAAQLHTLLENLPGQFTAVLDRQGRIRSSTGMARTHFRDDVELVGRPYSILLDPEEQKEGQLAAMIGSVTDGDHWVGTLWHERIDGVSFPARTFASPWVDRTDGRVLGVLVVARDASIEHTWRDRAHKSERFAAIGEFAASIASEFDEGLTRVADEVGGRDGVKAELARLHAFAGSVHELSEDSPADRGPVDLRRLAQEILDEAADRLAAAGIRASVEGPAAVPRVFADPSQVRRLLEILIGNAVDNVEAGGAGGWLRIELSSEPGGVVTRVSDSGPQVPEETLHRVFEPFFTTKPGRPGLGLSVARALVRAHEGRIWTDHDEDGRAIFAVQIPIGGGDVKARFRPAPLVLSQNHAILVVDDEEAIRLSMRRFLEKVGYDVREAWSGRSALAQITGGRPPELVLTDLRMRDGSGFWFLEELERDFPDLLRKTVILTGDPDHAEVKRLVARTGCPVVGKPVELPELLELLDEVTRRD
jgi:PAS domain S-box-containing protein